MQKNDGRPGGPKTAGDKEGISGGCENYDAETLRWDGCE